MYQKKFFTVALAVTVLLAGGLKFPVQAANVKEPVAPAIEFDGSTGRINITTTEDIHAYPVHLTLYEETMDGNFSIASYRTSITAESPDTFTAVEQGARYLFIDQGVNYYAEAYQVADGIKTPVGKTEVISVPSNIQTMQRPEARLQDGSATVITWDPVSNSDGYRVDLKFGTRYDGPTGTNWTDSLMRSYYTSEHTLDLMDSIDWDYCKDREDVRYTIDVYTGSPDVFKFTVGLSGTSLRLQYADVQQLLEKTDKPDDDSKGDISDGDVPVLDPELPDNNETEQPNNPVPETPVQPDITELVYEMSPDEELRYSYKASGLSLVSKYTDIEIEGEMQGEKFITAVDMIRGDYKIGATFNVYGKDLNSIQEQIVTIHLPMQLKERDVVIITVDNKGVPYQVGDLDHSPDKATFTLGKGYAYAICYK